jgi:hypothetical protein
VAKLAGHKALASAELLVSYTYYGYTYFGYTYYGASAELLVNSPL